VNNQNEAANDKAADGKAANGNPLTGQAEHAGDGGGIDFARLTARMTARTRRSCAGCGQTFRGAGGENLCGECQYTLDHPESADMYWTWTRAPRGRWGIAAHWPDAEPLPEPGDTATVHRKDGSQSTETITEVHGLHYLPTGRARLTCTVR
jgi:hypothetical protein